METRSVLLLLTTVRLLPLIRPVRFARSNFTATRVAPPPLPKFPPTTWAASCCPASRRRSRHNTPTLTPLTPPLLLSSLNSQHLHFFICASLSSLHALRSSISPATNFSSSTFSPPLPSTGFSTAYRLRLPLLLRAPPPPPHRNIGSLSQPISPRLPGLFLLPLFTASLSRPAAQVSSRLFTSIVPPDGLR